MHEQVGEEEEEGGLEVRKRKGREEEREGQREVRVAERRG